MTPRLRIASEQMAALLAADLRQPFDMQSPNKEIAARALDYADALIAEHERTSPQPGTAGRVPIVADDTGLREATAERVSNPPSPPAATPHEIPDEVVEAIRDAYFRADYAGNSREAMRAALREYDRLMPAVRGRVLGERWGRFAKGTTDWMLYLDEPTARSMAHNLGGTVHRVVLVEVGEES